jgi:hypothetical protein
LNRLGGAMVLAVLLFGRERLDLSWPALLRGR